MALLLSSCVGKGTYKRAMREISTLEDKVKCLEEEKEQLEDYVYTLEDEKQELKEQVEDAEDIIERAKSKVRQAEWDITIGDTFSASFSISRALSILNEF